MTNQLVRDVILLTPDITTVSKCRNIPSVTLSPFQGERPRSIFLLLLPSDKVPSRLCISLNIPNDPLIMYQLAYKASYRVSLLKSILTEVLTDQQVFEALLCCPNRFSLPIDTLFEPPES